MPKRSDTWPSTSPIAPFAIVTSNSYLPAYKHTCHIKCHKSAALDLQQQFCFSFCHFIYFHFIACVTFLILRCCCCRRRWLQARWCQICRPCMVQLCMCEYVGSPGSAACNTTAKDLLACWPLRLGRGRRRASVLWGENRSLWQ